MGVALIGSSPRRAVESLVRFPEKLVFSVDRFELKSQLKTTSAQNLLEDREARLPSPRLDVVDDGARYSRRRGELRNAEVSADARTTDKRRSELMRCALTHGVSVPNSVQESIGGRASDRAGGAVLHAGPARYRPADAPFSRVADGGGAQAETLSVAVPVAVLSRRVSRTV